MGSHYTRDLAVAGAVSVATVFIRTGAKHYFQARFPEWSSLSARHQSRLLVESAVIPSRIALIALTWPVVVNAFYPLSTWTADDTEKCLLACAVLTGAYCVDLSVTRNDKGATIHHMMGPALLLWIRTCFSTFTPADALMCRLLISFVFFGAVLSGSSTTSLSFLYHFRRAWFHNGTYESAAKGYKSFSLILPVLAFSTIVGTFYSTAYVHRFMDECKAYFGLYIYLPWAWLLLECGMQWNWIRTFFTFEERYRGEMNQMHEELVGKHEKGSKALDQPWWLPSWRYKAIRVLSILWFASAAGIIWRTGHLKFVAQFLYASIGQTMEDMCGTNWVPGGYLKNSSPTPAAQRHVEL